MARPRGEIQRLRGAGVRGRGNPLTPPGPHRRLVLAAAALAGAQSLAAQALLVREELVLYGGNEVALGAFFALWLLGLSVGAWAANRWAGEGAGRLAPTALALQGLLLAAALLAAASARTLSGVPAYEPFPLSLLLLWSIPVAVPVSFATGASVPALAAAGRAAGVSVTAVYAWEAAGSFAGGGAATLALAAGARTEAVLFACLAAGLLGASLLVSGNPRRVAVASAVCIAALYPLGGKWVGDILRERQLASAMPGAELLAHRETGSGSLRLARVGGIAEGRGGIDVLLVDGTTVAAFPDPERAERTAGVWLALTGAPRRLLVVGPGGADLLPGVTAFGALERVVWCVFDPGLADFALRHVPGLAADPRLTVFPGDPVRDERGLGALGPFDAVWVCVESPLTRADDRLVGAETMRTLARLLAPGGVVALPVRSGENYVGARLRLSVGTAAAAVARGVGNVTLTPGEEAWVLGSPTPGRVTLDPARLDRSYLSLRPSEVRLTAESFAGLFPPDRTAKAGELLAALLADPRTAPPDDDRPAALFRNLLVRAEKEGVEAAELLEGLARRRAVWGVVAGVAGLLALATVAGRRTKGRALRGGALCLLAACGASGMALDLLLLHHYQGVFGTVYLEAGWLFALWMAGIAAGGLGFRTIARSRTAAAGTALAISLASLAAALALGGAGFFVHRAAGWLLFLLGGALTGGLIPVAEALLAGAGAAGAAAGADIESADNLGGAAAALAVGTLVLPVAGLAATAWGVAATSLFALLAMGTAAKWEKLAWLRPARPLFPHFPFPAAGWILFALGAAAVAGSAAVRLWVAEPRLRLEPAEAAEAGLAGKLREVPEPFPHYREARAGGAAAFATRAAGRADGYGGPVNLLTAVDGRGRILSVGFLEHRETPSYVEGADRFFAGLAGRDISRELVLRRPGEADGGVDGITGATVTSEAVLAALNAAGERLSLPLYGKPYGRSARRGGFPWRAAYLAGSSLALLALLRRPSKWVRRAWLALHAVVGGGWLGVQLSTVQGLALLRGEPGLNLASWTGWLVLAGFGLALLFGPVYCGWLCPAGAAQELLGLAGTRLGLARRLPPRADRGLRFAKYALLAAIVVGALGFGAAWVERLDLLRFLWTANRPLASLAPIALAAVGSLFVVRLGCRALCPTGALLALSNRFAPLARLLPAKRYDRCDLGTLSPADAECLRCDRCLAGEEAPAASRRRSRLGVAAVALALAVLLAAAVWPRWEEAPPGAVRPTITKIDEEDALRRITAGRLSSHPALYWRKVER